eukprot:COSAG01_NODE_27748_length_677_cov_31.311419_2_plen_98_part_01
MRCCHAGCRTLPRAFLGRYVEITAEEAASCVRWVAASAATFGARLAGGNLLFTPTAGSPGSTTPLPLRQGYTARMLKEWGSDPASVCSQLSLSTTPTD